MAAQRRQNMFSPRAARTPAAIALVCAALAALALMHFPALRKALRPRETRVRAPSPLFVPEAELSSAEAALRGAAIRSEPASRNASSIVARRQEMETVGAGGRPAWCEELVRKPRGSPMGRACTRSPTEDLCIDAMPAFFGQLNHDGALVILYLRSPERATRPSCSGFACHVLTRR
jgi:hypothetical protein